MGLFPHYQGQPGAIRGAANDLIAGSKQVNAVKSAAMSQQSTALSAVSGSLLAPMSCGTEPVVAGAADTSGAAIIASGALDMFSTCVDTYNTGVDRLNAQYDAAAASSFGVSPSSFTGNGCGPPPTPEESLSQFEDAVLSAAAGLKAQLVAEFGKLKDELDSKAETVAAILAKGGEAALLALGMNGALPALASIDFPDFFKKFKFTYDRATQLYGLLGLGNNVRKFVNSASAINAATLALLQGKNLADAQVQAVLRVVGGDATDLRVLNQFFRGEEALDPLRDASLLAQAGKFNMLDAATATSGFSKVLGAVGAIGGIVDIAFNPSDHDGLRRATDIAGDSAGIVAGVGGIALGTGLVAAGTTAAVVLAPVVVVAGAVALTYGVGTFVYDHWDDISDGVSAAADWTSDAAGNAVDFAEDTVDDVADWAQDTVEDIPVIGGLFS